MTGCIHEEGVVPVEVGHTDGAVVRQQEVAPGDVPRKILADSGEYQRRTWPSH